MTLLQIQVELKAPKNQYNKFGRYNYRSTEDILSAVKPLLAKYGDDLDLSDEPILIGEWHYIKATATFTDKDQKKTIVTGYAREAERKKGMDESQITGTASSYARKYALNGLFLIDDTKDADSSEYLRQNNNRKSSQQQNQPQANNYSHPQQQNHPAQQIQNAGQAVTASLENKYKAAVSKFASLTGVSFAEANATISNTLKGNKEYLAIKDKNAKINKATNVVNIMIQQTENGGNN